MAIWLKKFSKLLALAFDTRIKPEQQSALAKATELAGKHKCTLGRAYMLIGRRYPIQYLYLEAKRKQSEIPSFETRADLATYWLDPEDSLAMQAMKSCYVSPQVFAVPIPEPPRD